MHPKLFFLVWSLFTLSRMCRVKAADQCPAQEPIYWKALKGYTFKTLQDSSPFGCLYDCHYEARCQSYNFVINGSICEMNNRTKDAKPDNFVSDPKRFYMKRGAHRVALGSTPSLSAESCREIKANEAGDAVSGNSWLDPTGSGEVVLAYCDMNTEDFCIQHGCQNGALCVNGPLSYTCSCKELWTGTYCETPILDFCIQHGCKNGASCVNGRLNYTCSCKGLWTGIYCESPIQIDNSTKKFGVIVETSTVWGAGTDAFLYLQLIGTNGTESEERKVGTEDGSNNDFENGQTDRFVVSFEDVGTISKLRIRLVENPESPWGGGWTMAKITIKDLSSGRKYTFNGPKDVYPGDTFVLNAS